jgi:tripartite-type tricarboxylate transporter receptor subunit TctC
VRRFAALCVCLALQVVAGTAGAAEFYAGKTITMATPTGPGGGYDTYLRLLGAHMGRHIPGNPSFIVVNQPGAGGIRALNYAGRVAPKDGTFLTMASQGSYLLQATGGEGFQVSLGDFHWLGNFVQSNDVIVTWHASGVKTLADARTRASRLGATGPAAVSSQVPLLFNALAGTKFEVIRGYTDSGQMNIAMERGEIDGRGANMWATYKLQSPDEIRDGRFNALVQLGMRKEPDLPNVPLLADLVKGDPRKEAIAHFVALAQDNARAVAAPPGVPADRVAMLRRAFAETMKDREFLTAAERTRLEISPMTGEEVAEIVRQVLSTPKDVVDATKSIVSQIGR